MSSCPSCGHPLGAGRFCTHCGAPVADWRTDTAERKLPRPAPAVVPPDPRTPPSAVAPPPPPRYPMYADEVEGYSTSGPLTVPADPPPEPVAPPTPAAAPATYAEPYEAGYDDERRSPVLWILVAALVLVVVAGGWWFLVRDDSAGSATDSGRGSGGSTGEPSASAPAGTDIASRATAEAPETAPPNQDVDGRQVSYDASNMLDGVPTTAWRMPGSGAGKVLTFTLPEEATLVQVGMVNGYAKSSTDDQGRSFDWYRGNRRVRAVVWVFDDGTKVRQRLTDSRDVQLLDLEQPVTTTTVKAKLVKVTPPGQGDTGRDYTAISEVSLVAVS